MSYIDTIKGRAALQQIADREGKCLAEIEGAIQEAIDLAWGDPAAREYQMIFFPKGKPTAAEFVGRLAKYIRERQTFGE